jgi:hypothetical protein
MLDVLLFGPEAPGKICEYNCLLWFLGFELDGQLAYLCFWLIFHCSSTCEGQF